MNKLLQKPSPLSRSSTDPSHRLLPPKPAIKKSRSQDQDQVLVILHKSEAISKNEGRQNSSDPSQRSVKSATASLLGCAEHSGYSYPNIKTDTPTSTIAAPQDALHRAFPVRKSSMKKTFSPEPPYIDRGEDQLSTAAHVSVARQVSISRRQRQILVPIAPKTTRQQPWIDE